MTSLKSNRHLKASILLVLFGTGLLIGCSTLREESVVSGKRKATPEAELTERLVAIQARPTNFHSNNSFEAERLWGPYNDWEPAIAIDSARGNTWTAPITITTKSTQPNWSDKTVLAVSADRREVYIAFNASDSYVAASYDYGASFSQPVRTSNDKRYWFHTGDSAGAPQCMWVRTSTDGVNWNERREISNGSVTVSNAFSALAAGPNPGDFRLAWQDDRSGSTFAWNIWYRRTSDSGNNWTEAVRVSDQSIGAPYETDTGYAFPYGDYFEIAVDAEGLAHLI